MNGAVHWMRSNNLASHIKNKPEITSKIHEDTGLVEIFIDGNSVIEWVSEDGDPEPLLQDFTRILYIGILLSCDKE